MTNWKRWSTSLLLCSAASLATAGCLEDDPNQDGDTGTGTQGTDDSGNGPGNGPNGGTLDDSGTATDPTNPPTDTEPGVTTEADDVTIYDIQMGMVAEGTVVTLTDVVVTSPVNVAQGGVTVQDQGGGPFSGIYLFLFDEVVTGAALSPGDVITLTGEYTEFFDFSQITISSVDSISVTSTTDVPAPITVTPSDIVAGAASAESYESVVVRVENVTATDSTNEFGDFHVDDNMAVSNFWLFEQGGPLEVIAGTEIAFLQGPLLYSFEEFKLAPRTEADYSATLVPCADAATPATIYEIQQGMGVSPGDLVLVEDVIVTTPLDFSGETFFVQEPGGGEYSGISVFLGNAAGFVPAPGTQVTLCGQYDEFFDLSQLEVASAADITEGGMGPSPTPSVVTSGVLASAMGEAWEGVLVQVDDATVTTEANEFGEWEVDSALLLDDLFFAAADWPAPTVGTAYSQIVGVLNYSFSNYKLAPRTAADIVAE